MMSPRPLPAALLVLGVVLAFLAWGTRFISSAHGHGLASQDRTTIIVLAVLATAALISGTGLIARRFIAAREE